MTTKISLSYFNSENHHYHVYKIKSSEVSEEPHCHDFYQVCYVVKGNIIHKQSDEIVYLHEGDAFIVPPNFVHSIIFKSDDSEIYSLSFEEELFQFGFIGSSSYKFLTSLKIDSASYNHIEVRLKVHLDETQRLNTDLLFKCLIREFKENRPIELSSSSSLISSILIILAQAYFLSPYGQQRLNEINEYHVIIEKCIKYIDQNYMNDLNLNDLTRKFALSRSMFSLIFPQIAGMSLIKYINKRRIEQAKLLSRISTISLNEISITVGYQNFTTFYRNFVKLVGISPVEYRNHIQSDNI